jgi:hypothetical protein
MTLIRPAIAAILLLLIPSGRTAGAERPTDGAWQRIGTNDLLLVAPERLVLHEHDHTRVAKILRAAPLTIRYSGEVAFWSLSVDGDRLTLTRGTSAASFQRLANIPEELKLRPLPVARTAPLPEARVAETRTAVEKLRDREQAVMTDPQHTKEDVEALRGETLSWFETTLPDLGWVDAARFGEHTSFMAVILAKHTASLRLLSTILPFVEKDFRDSGSRAQAFAITYDEVQLFLGEKQKYGTQVCGTPADPYVCPMVDPQRVHALRKELGLDPLAQYLEELAGAIYAGHPVRMPTPQESGDAL